MEGLKEVLKLGFEQICGGKGRRVNFGPVLILTFH